MKKLILSALAGLFSFGLLAQDELFTNSSQFGMGSSLLDAGALIAYDQNNDIIIAGTFEDDMDFDLGDTDNTIDPLGEPDIFVAKYQGSGDLMWVFNLGRIGLNDGMNINGLKVNESNEIFISGSFSNTVDFDPLGSSTAQTSVGGKDAFMAKYDMDGELIWVETYGSALFENGRILDIDQDGNIYLSIRYNGEIDVDPGAGEVIISPQAGAADAVLVKYNSSNEYQWHYAISSADNDNITCISVASNGKVAVGSTVNGSASGFSQHDMQLSMLGSDGSLDWEYNFSNYEQENSISKIKFADANASIYVGGRIRGETAFDPADENDVTDPLFADPFLAKYQVNDGGLLWARTIKSAGTQDFLTGLALAGNAVFVAGSFNISATFDPGDFSTQKVSAGGSDIFLAAYNQTDGAYLGVESFGGEGSEVSLDTEFSPGGDIAMTGSFTGTLEISPGGAPVSSVGYSDIFFAEFTYQTDVSDGITRLNATESISIYPNPAKDELFFSSGKSNDHRSVEVKVFNVVGRVVKHETVDLSIRSAKLDISELNPGVYIIEFASADQRLSKRFVKR